MQGSVKMKNYNPYKDVTMESEAETACFCLFLLIEITGRVRAF